MQDVDNKFALTLDLINNTQANIFLTGKAGTGKTTFLRSLRDTCLKNFIVVAPTGIAAVNARGVTMHSFFQLPFGPYLPYMHGMKSRIGEKKGTVINDLELLIIDEVSMLRADMLDAIDYRLRTVRRNREPFGGVQLLLIGDLFQLPPVAVAGELTELNKFYDSLFFFDSNALKKSGFITVEFNKIFRQENAQFKDILNNVRSGNVSSTLLQQLNQRYIPNFRPNANEQYIKLVTHNLQADEINQREMAMLNSDAKSYSANISGNFPESSFPVAQHLELKVGTHVMTTKNKAGEYYNGSLGIITALKENSVMVRLTDTNREIEITPEKWENIDYQLIAPPAIDTEGRAILNAKPRIEEQCIGSFSQLPLRLAWAITIHKSQGLTFDRAIIDAHRSFMPGQTYVALSRCRTLEGIVLSQPIEQDTIMSNQIVEQFYAEELKKFPDEAGIKTLKMDAYIHYVRRTLDLENITDILGRIISYAANHISDKYIDQIDKIKAAANGFTSSLGNKTESYITYIDSAVKSSSNYAEDANIQLAIANSCRILQQDIKSLAFAIVDINFDLGNKTHQKNIDKMMAELKHIIKFHHTLFSYIIKSGFHIDEIQKLIQRSSTANFGLDSDEKTSKEKKSKKTKAEDNSPLPPIHQEVYDKLAAWRLAKARELGKPAFIVITNSPLQEIAARLPQSEDQLAKIKGIGPNKVAQYGEEILEIISNYLNS